MLPSTRINAAKRATAATVDYAYAVLAADDLIMIAYTRFNWAYMCVE